ncbi:ABC transporter ATP-binding protein [Pseudochelatococcus contaminans]|uniref:Spermidine/putrescine transport system ATP-binding protein n=1 Tax=Pseudochelatococcus contaminans TaxID=1538103 RepID=A0A7W5Z540_9HYPH|nr:ABC transporter ATP-binding protein [Pseudochelatococcus contaminans]MBB3810267.1 spermidine/putrescine transport system ATP-binding protein [Pseudochelatococcus contaminans]
MAVSVSIENLTIRYGDSTAVTDVSFDIQQGEFFTLLGPSGCGKTTILRAIAGFIEPSAGEIRIGGQSMRGVGANRRPTALVFQSLALFPTMSVADNIGYGLRVRGVGKAERNRRVDELLQLVALEDHGRKGVNEISGGQRQRVAIARALAVEPTVLLLDEPLSALDLKLRQHMRAELRAIQRRVGTTFIYITHDQGEALAMSDRIAVMNAGRIEQIGEARGIYTRPETAFVAGFVGETNRVPGRVLRTFNGSAVLETPLGNLAGLNPAGLAIGDKAAIFVRPEALKSGTGGENHVSGQADTFIYEGNFGHLSFLVNEGHALTALLPPDTGAIPERGQPVSFSFGAGDAIILAD